MTNGRLNGVKLWKYFVGVGVHWMTSCVPALYVLKAMKLFEDAPETLEYLAILNALGFLVFYWVFVLDLRGLPLRVFTSTGLCLQVSMIFVYLAHFVWPKHEMLVGVATVLVLIGIFAHLLSDRPEGKPE